MMSATSTERMTRLVATAKRDIDGRLDDLLRMLGEASLSVEKPKPEKRIEVATEPNFIDLDQEAVAKQFASPERVLAHLSKFSGVASYSENYLSQIAELYPGWEWALVEATIVLTKAFPREGDDAVGYKVLPWVAGYVIGNTFSRENSRYVDRPEPYERTDLLQILSGFKEGSRAVGLFCGNWRKNKRRGGPIIRCGYDALLTRKAMRNV